MLYYSYSRSLTCYKELLCVCNKGLMCVCNKGLMCVCNKGLLCVCYILHTWYLPGGLNLGESLFHYKRKVGSIPSKCLAYID